METLKFEELVRAIVARDALAARQWVADAIRARLRVDSLPEPDLSDQLELSVAAGVAELLAERFHQSAPKWSARIGAVKTPFYVSASLEKMKRSAEDARRNGPEPLRRRNVFASPTFLSVV